MGRIYFLKIMKKWIKLSSVKTFTKFYDYASINITGHDDMIILRYNIKEGE